VLRPWVKRTFKARVTGWCHKGCHGIVWWREDLEVERCMACGCGRDLQEKSETVCRTAYKLRKIVEFNKTYNELD